MKNGKKNGKVKIRYGVDEAGQWSAPGVQGGRSPRYKCKYKVQVSEGACRG